MSLFTKLPEDIFRPLAASNRAFYADLLLHLYEHTFAAIGGVPRKSDVIADIGDFMDDYSRRHGPIAKEDLGLSAQAERSIEREANDQDTLRYGYFRYLADCGWLVEFRDRFRKLVDLSAEGRLLLREFQKIVVGDTRSYGGAVLNVLGQLEQAHDYPEDRSECIFNAWTFARDFSHHLRTIASEMRRVEDRVLAQEGHRAVFRAFFDEFVSKVLIADYKTLKTKNNPFRFRYKILDRVHEIEADALLMTRLAKAYIREARSKTEGEAEHRIRRELAEVYAVFDTIDQQIDVIGETQMRVESKIHTMVRFMDRHDGGAVDRAARALRALGATAAPADSEVVMQPHVLLLSPLLGPDILYAQRQGKREIERSRVRAIPVDPARQAFHQAKRDYAKRVAISPQRLTDYIAKVLAGRDSILGSEIDVQTVDDFIVFQRLRDTPFIFDGLFRDYFSVTPIDQRVENDWLEFADFRLSRKKSGARQ